MNKIKRIERDKETKKVISTEIYNNIKDAAASVNSNLDSWKVQMLIVDAINHRKNAFKYKWEKVN
jgi:hypothetical protein